MKQQVLERARSAVDGFLHRQCADATLGVLAPPSFPDGVREFGQAFSVQRRKRHLADYALDFRIGKSEVIAAINDARTAIDRFLAAPANIRRDFAIHVLTKARRRCLNRALSAESRRRRSSVRSVRSAAAPMAPPPERGGGQC